MSSVFEQSRIHAAAAAQAKARRNRNLMLAGLGALALIVAILAALRFFRDPEPPTPIEVIQPAPTTPDIKGLVEQQVSEEQKRLADEYEARIKETEEKLKQVQDQGRGATPPPQRNP